MQFKYFVLVKIMHKVKTLFLFKVTKHSQFDAKSGKNANRRFSRRVLCDIVDKLYPAYFAAEIADIS